LCFAPLLKRNSNILDNFEVFVIELSATFEESDKKRVAKHKYKIFERDLALLLYMQQNFDKLFATSIGMKRDSLVNFEFISNFKVLGKQSFSTG
jgi:hypothetical protein